MRIHKLWIVAALALVSWSLVAHVPDYVPGRNTKKVQYRGVCANSKSQIDQEINNVRARLLNGGDCWWDFNDGRYIVPKVDVSTGQKEVSSIYAGSVWLGGIDPAGNLKLACQDYGHQTGTNDFWPGPLNESGTTDEFTCENWDKHFRVTGDEIRKHLANIAAGNLSPDVIPRGVKGWPARGNPFFADVWGFDLPYTKQALAGFYDADKNNDYDPRKGDYPSIEIRNCEQDRYPDEMIFWIYNDQGGGAPHARTKGNTIQMEVQVQAFGYLTNDQLNDMTFQRYKLINRAPERIDSTFFAMWVDADLGCFLDDYIGCDSSLSLMYTYNGDADDGQPGCDCASTTGQVPTYCENVPILGVDYFRGPLDTFGNEIGMSSFVYYNNPSYNNPPPYSHDPDLPLEFYRYLTGSWKDGQPFTYGGDGYGGTIPVKYALSDPPNDPAGWSMCSANLAVYDRRTLQASGPFTLLPGAVNELIIGIPWVPDIDYPCPDVEQIFRADLLAQGLFDNCFDLLDGPDAPDVDWIELNQQIVAVLSNDTLGNNGGELYKEFDIFAPKRFQDSEDPIVRDSASYKFEGYRIFQLINPNVSSADFENPDKSRPVYQVDIKNGVAEIYNWRDIKNPINDTISSNNTIQVPELQVDGEDLGLRHTFQIIDDKFASGNDKRLINHKKYYYAVIAYAYNNYETFDPLTRPERGQKRNYLAGRKAADGPIKIFTVIPRPIVDQVLQTSYGDGVIIKRIEGVGNGGNFVDLDPDSRNSLLDGSNPDTILTYRGGRGPVSVTIFNPFEVKDGDYELRVVDSDLTDNKIDRNARWELRNLTTNEIVASERTIEEINEQLVPKYGFSITIVQQGLPGIYTWSVKRPDLYFNPGEANGGIGAEVEYADRNVQWLNGFADAESGPLNFVKTNKLERDAEYDPFQGLSTLGEGWFVPYALCDWELGADPLATIITPAWTPQQSTLNESAIGTTANQPTSSSSRYNRLVKLPSVDIVLTSDTSKWSRCVIVETASLYFTSSAFPSAPSLKPESVSPTKSRLNFDARYSPSVGKFDADGDGYPDPDGAKEADGKPMLGMGWFPGYAVDVVTGRRLNVFFGENSAYSNDRLFNGSFFQDLNFWTASSGWKWESGAAAHTPGSANDSLSQIVPEGVVIDEDYTVRITISNRTAGDVSIALGDGAPAIVADNGMTTRTVVSKVATGSTARLVIKASNDFNGRIERIELLDPFRANFTGRDMLWNPTDQVSLLPSIVPLSQQPYYTIIMGGQHWLYVMNTEYDGCEAARKRFTPEFGTSAALKVNQIGNIAWAGMVNLAESFSMKSLREGLIPNDAVVKLRVASPYGTWYDDDNGKAKTGHPLYQFKIENKQAKALDRVQIESAMDSIKVVPNPYYGFSEYETSNFSNTVKITNLPAKCTVTIYSLDGKFIRQFKRDEVYMPYDQIAPDLEWDLQNNKGIPVASGVYLIHVQAPGMGERTIKWFGIARKFDPSGL